MPKPDGPNFTALTHQVVRESPEPLTSAEISRQVEVLAAEQPHRDRKKTVRGIIGQSAFIGALGDGRYGWRPRLLNGSTVRHVLSEDDLKGPTLPIGQDLDDLLWLLRYGSGDIYFPLLPITLELSNGTSLTITREQQHRQVSLVGIDPFLTWVCAKGARPDDSLLFTAIDGEARRYKASFEPRKDRDEQAIAQRNQQMLATAVAFLRKRKGDAPLWETIPYLMNSGAFRDLPPPEPFMKLWTADVWGPIVDEFDSSPYLVGGLPLDTLFELPRVPQLAPLDPVELQSIPLPPGVTPEMLIQLQERINGIINSPEPPQLDPNDPQTQIINLVMAGMGLPSPTGKPYKASELLQLFGPGSDVVDWIEDGITIGMVEADAAYEELLNTLPVGPEDLPPAYQRSDKPRKPQPSPVGSKGPVKTYVLRVSYRYEPDFWREIEIAEDQNLEDLHLAIQQALKWDDDHLYSFFMGKRPYDEKREIGSPWSEAERRTYTTTIGSLKLKLKQKFLYLFDFGDDHLFDIQVMSINPQAPKGKYPKVVGKQGKALEQYLGGDDDWGEIIWE
jgi:hypothetical protein